MIFLIAEPADLIDFRAILSCGGQYKTATGTFKRLIQNFANPKELKIIGYCCDTVNDQKCKELSQIRMTFPHVKILLFTSQIVLTVYQTLLQIQNLFIYQRSVPPEDINAVVKEVMTNEHVKPRTSETFFTNQRVRIIVTRTGQFMETMLRSYSDTEAFIEYKGIAIQKGDLLQIGLLDDADSHERQHQQIKAVVLSLTSKTFETTKKGIAVKFIHTSLP